MYKKFLSNGSEDYLSQAIYHLLTINFIFWHSIQVSATIIKSTANSFLLLIVKCGGRLVEVMKFIFTNSELKIVIENHV